MVLWQFTLHLPQFDNVDKTTLFYKNSVSKVGFLKYMTII